MGRTVFFVIINFLILRISTHFVSSQPVTITGTAHGAEGKTIILKTYSDFFTYNENFIAKSTIDSLGNFTLNGYINGTSLGIIHIEYYSGEIHLEPNKQYQIEIRNLVFNEKFDRVNHNLQPFYCYIKVITHDTNETNTLIQKLNIMYNSFLRENLVLIKNNKASSKVDKFFTAIADTFSGVQNVFFQNYLRYRLASLKLLTNYSDNYKLMVDYIYNNPILYDNIEYFSFIKSYFENYFENLTRPVTINDLFEPINNNASYFELMDVIGKDSLLKNEKLRELIAINILNSFYASPSFNKASILTILKHISATSKFEQHRAIAKSIYSYLTRFDKGMPAPNFELLSNENKFIRLSDFKGKIVYIVFYASWCVDCRAEMEIMKKLANDYGNKVVFISISVDREFEKMYHFARDNKYPWTFLHFNNDYDLLESYGVYAYPTFVLIDAGGNFIQCPALKPSDNIESVLKNL